MRLIYFKLVFYQFKIRIIISLLLILLFVSCKNEEKKYLFLGHIYEYEDAENRMDRRVEQIPFNKYNGVWIGGDVLFYGITSQKDIDYLDSVFSFSSGNVNWALGNHDIVGDSKENILSLKGKPEYYAEYSDGMTLLTLNTNYNNLNCNQLNKQFSFFKHLCDTIEKTRVLIVLSHHFVWGNLENSNTAEFANGDMIGWRTSCDKGNIFDNTFYELLKELRKRCKVVWIAGDMGQKRKEDYKYESKDSIIFLASGLGNSKELKYNYKNKPKDRVLELIYFPDKNELDFQFVTLDDLIN